VTDPCCVTAVAGLARFLAHTGVGRARYREKENAVPPPRTDLSGRR
jgi:hypothetical protein